MDFSNANTAVDQYHRFQVNIYIVCAFKKLDAYPSNQKKMVCFMLPRELIKRVVIVHVLINYKFCTHLYVIYVHVFVHDYV